VRHRQPLATKTSRFGDDAAVPRGWFLFVALVVGVASDGPAQARSGAVDIRVTVPSSIDSVHVEERYVLAPSPSGVELRVLSRPCATIENLRVEPPSALTQSHKRPWITWRDTTEFADSLRLFVRYDVRVRGTGVIPLVHVATAMSAVSVTVRFDDDARRVVFPHMTRQAPGEWSAHYVAAPSFIEVTDVRNARCAEGGKGQGDNGGLVWRFLLLVGIMVAWVPLYLAWARRSAEADGA
jgi:hypothetical protein